MQLHHVHGHPCYPSIIQSSSRSKAHGYYYRLWCTLPTTVSEHVPSTVTKLRCFVNAVQVLTHDFTHPPKNPVTDKGRFTMEDYKRFLLTFGALLFASDPGHPMLHKDMEDAYGYLRRLAVNHSTVHGPEEESVRLARIQDFHEQFLAFSELAVTVRARLQLIPALRILQHSALFDFLLG